MYTFGATATNLSYQYFFYPRTKYNKSKCNFGVWGPVTGKDIRFFDVRNIVQRDTKSHIFVNLFFNKHKKIFVVINIILYQYTHPLITYFIG